MSLITSFYKETTISYQHEKVPMLHRENWIKQVDKYIQE